MCNVKMIRLVSEKKVQSDDGKTMKFMISFGALQKLVSEEVGQPGQARPGHLRTLRLQLLTSSLRPLYLVATFVFVPNGDLEKLWNGPVRIWEKMHFDDGRMIKFMISFGSVTETSFWRSRHVWMPDSSRRSNYYIRSARELLALKLSYS